jgi:sugar phosphate isomerase/epimerase
MDPKIHLAIDNCFACKRWTSPREWARVVRELGLKNVECVADLEIEPFLMEAGYRDEWAREVAEIQSRGDVQVVMMYSGNSTYDTIGLAHPDARVRNRIVLDWFGGFMDTAVSLDAMVGYFVHAFPESILFDKRLYETAYENMRDSVARLNALARRKKVSRMAIEQMYTPHQAPFTIAGMRSLMRDTRQRSGKDLYMTEDVGHHCPFYARPTAESIRNAHARYARDGYVEIWLGSKEAYERFRSARTEGGAMVEEDLRWILSDVEANPHLFSSLGDTDCYTWLREMGRYSPVIHLQQTDGTYSQHRTFTKEENARGIIEPSRVLKALGESFGKCAEEDMPPVCEDIYLTFEFYGGTKDIGYQLLYRIDESVKFWRRFVPRDGMRLSELLERMASVES